ncbi:MAG TPA: glycosyltransferase [Gammaproteobacteria bacterium]|nr:glycosyltransferase [Gammaproteobacteria bacterium]
MSNKRPVRARGIAMVRQGSAIRVINHLTRAQSLLNTSLAGILSLCDGTVDPCELMEILASHYSDSKLSYSDVQSGLDLLLAHSLISLQSKGSSGKLLCVGFQGFDPKLDVLDNYFTYALSLIGSVLIVDPRHIPPDILLVWQQVESVSPNTPINFSEHTVTVQVACYGVKTDLKQFDFSISGNHVDKKDLCRHVQLAIKDSRDPIFLCHGYAHILPASVKPEYCAQKINKAAFSACYRANMATHKSRLTIGMASYDDYDGVYFTIQSIRLFHPEVVDQVEFLILDNNPKGHAAKSLRDLASDIPNVRYLPFSGFTGTAVREQLFHYADSQWMLCLDSHIMLAPRAIYRLLEYIDGLDDCKDLLQGPLLNNQLSRLYTHFKQQWQNGMYGVWATDKRGLDENAVPFQISMQGLGLFACQKQAWPGLHPGFRGFGGEEGYLHEKFRRVGGRTLCLPFLRWIHRFGRPREVPYKNTWEDRLRNYLLGHKELAWDTEPVRRHFSEFMDPRVVQQIEYSVMQSGNM